MEAFLKSQMDSIGMPGLSFAVINDEQIVYHKTLGVTNFETKQQVSDETIFDAASMTKTPFAFLVMRLAEKGILDLDKPLFTYLPYPISLTIKGYKLITARMVLSHTTGFPIGDFLTKMENWILSLHRELNFNIRVKGMNIWQTLLRIL